MPDTAPPLLRTGLYLATSGVPVVPLSRGKRPVGNCSNCAGLACGGRPHMKTPGPCACLFPCHGWAAATTNPRVLTSRAWKAAWRAAGAVAYHPGGAGLTVVDLDTPEAVTWARSALPATRTVLTSRGQHWLYQGMMPSANEVQPGVDIKSRQSYAQWRGPGTGTLAALPEVVRTLVVKEASAVQSTARAVTVPARAGDAECRHRTPAYLERGIAMAEHRIAEARSAIHATVYQTFLAVLSAHGRCGCLTDGHIARLFAAAQAKGESPRHCTDAWTNARTRLGM